MKNQILGGLIEFESQEKLIEFVENINNEMSLRIIEGALEYGVRNGLYSLEETYCAYKSLYRVKFCVDNYGNGFKGPNPVSDVELDGNKQE